MKLWERIMEISLQRSFFYPSNEIYSPIGGFYDYGPVGILLKRKIENLWRKMFIYDFGFLEVESSIITPSIVLKASGHVDGFADPIVECKNCKKKVRADHLAEEIINGFKWDGKIESLRRVYFENKERLKCPSCGGEVSEPAYFNLMFKTGIGSEMQEAFCRPETAQGIFTAFKRLYRNHGTKLPLGVGQVGKSFRNEISPRNVLIRMREFTQMELEYFYDPNDTEIDIFDKVKEIEINFIFRENQKNNQRKVEKIKIKDLVEKNICNKIFAAFLGLEWIFYKKTGLNMEKCAFRHLLEDETPHYSNGNIDLEVETSYGIIEICGNADRTDYDLSRHEEYSKNEIKIISEKTKNKIVPYVFEASMGVDRLIFSIMEHTFREKSKEKDWEWFDFPAYIAPYEVGVFPLVKKDNLDKKAKEIYEALKEEFYVFYSESGSIGRRYAKADEIGVPYAVTIDYETLKDESVTIRYRNNGIQERVKITKLSEKIKNNIKENKIKG